MTPDESRELVLNHMANVFPGCSTALLLVQYHGGIDLTYGMTFGYGNGVPRSQEEHKERHLCQKALLERLVVLSRQDPECRRLCNRLAFGPPPDDIEGPF